jgi:hypothetical protein
MNVRWCELHAALSLILVAGTVSSIQTARACDVNESCNVCVLRNPLDNNCIQTGNDPVCESRKAVCQQCMNIKSLVTGTSYTCVACVMVSSPSNPACVAACGTAANARAVAAAGDCK